MCADRLLLECVSARPYYYNILYDQDKEDIPDTVLKHIAQCRHCRAEMNRLKGLLEHLGKSHRQQDITKNSYIEDILRLHFAYMGKSVNCSDVKPFLPTLAVYSLEIKIPTPITVHLNHCNDCSDDLLKLIKLDLAPNQLIKLAQFLAQVPSKESISCEKAQSVIPAVVSTASDKINLDVLQHLNACDDCRDFLYQYWESVRAKLPCKEKTPSGYSCNRFSRNELFDYCLPYGLDSSNGRYARLRESVTLHLRQCLTCLDQMLYLHRSIYNITDRPNSQVVTRFTVEEQTKVPAGVDSDDLYADWPINVEVSRKAKLRPASLAVLPRQLSRKVSSLNLRRFIKPVAATAAAIILISSFFLFGISSAKALTFQQLCKAIENINNACVVEFTPGNSQPLQEKWISRSLNVQMFKASERFVLWDITNKVKKTKYLSSDAVTNTVVSEEMVTRTQRTMTSSLALTPFSQLDEMPGNAVWSRVPDEDVQAGFSDAEVYDLTWVTESAVLTWHKWRFFIDTSTNLPKRLEKSIRWGPEKDYTLIQYLVITTTSEDEIKAAIQRVFD